jgi:hypothetical protein
MFGKLGYSRIQTTITITLIAIVPNDFRKGNIIKQYIIILVARIMAITAPH